MLYKYYVLVVIMCKKGTLESSIKRKVYNAPPTSKKSLSNITNNVNKLAGGAKMNQMYTDLVSEYVSVYTDAPVNPVFEGKLFLCEGYLELDPGYNAGETSQKIHQGLKNRAEADPIFCMNLMREDVKKRLEAEFTTEKIAEEMGSKIRIPLERIVAVSKAIQKV